MKLTVNVAGLTEDEARILEEHHCKIEREAYQIDKITMEGTRTAIEHASAPFTEFFKLELDDGTQVLEINVRAMQLSLLIVDVDLHHFELPQPDQLL